MQYYSIILRVYHMKNNNVGAVLIESVFVIPMVLLLIFGFIEINRLRTAQRILDSLALNLANEMATFDVTQTRVKKIIESNLISGSLSIVSNLKNYSSNLKYYIDVYNTGYNVNVNPAISWNRINGDILFNNDEEKSNMRIKRGAVIIVTFVYKFKFLSDFTRLAFKGKKSKNADDYILLHSRSISKRI